MPSQLNETILTEYRALANNASQCVLVDCVGLTVEESGELRGLLKEQQLSLNVVRNRLAKIAYQEAGLDGFGDCFQGPTALVYGEGADGAVTAAKVVTDFRKKIKSPKKLPAIKGGIFEGEVLDASRASALAKLPSKAELQSMLVGTALSPGRRVAGCVVSPASRIAGAVKSLVEKLESDA